jgi:hypothetical protein
MLIRSGAKSATGRANRQESLRCQGLFRTNIDLVQTLYSDACRIDASNWKPVKFRMWFGGTPESGGDRPQPAADGGSQSFRIGGHDQNETSQEHAQAKRRQASGVLMCIKRDRVRQSCSRTCPADNLAPGVSPLSESAALGVGRIGQLLRPGLQVTPEQHCSKHHEHRNDADGNE